MNPSRTRRRIVKGTLSAPLVLTVSSVAAQARTSFTACLNNTASQPKPFNVMATGYAGGYSGDDWLRVQVDIYKVKTPDATGNLVERPGSYFIGHNKQTFFKLSDTSPATLPATQVSEFNTSTYGLQKTVVGRRYALAYVDEQGKVVGYAWQSNSGTHCKKSCYSSVIAQAGRQRWI